MSSERAARGAATPHPYAALTLVAVVVGGALGTAARMGFAALVGVFDPASASIVADNAIDAVTAFTDPALIATLGVNLLGTLILGVAVGAHWPPHLDWLRAGIGAGFCGAFTTFSFVALVFAVLGFTTPWGWGLLIFGVLGGLLSAAIGVQLGRAASPQPVVAPGDLDSLDPEAEADS